MNLKSRILEILFVTSVLGGVVGVVLAFVTAAMLCGGWVLTWMFPAISVEFACVISGLALLTTIIVTACIARIVSKAMASEAFQNRSESVHGEDDDDDSDDEDDSDEAAEWLAERIAEITAAKVTKRMGSIERPYPTKSQRLKP